MAGSAIVQTRLGLADIARHDHPALHAETDPGDSVAWPQSKSKRIAKPSKHQKRPQFPAAFYKSLICAAG
ncbi:hypothetical protein C1J02_03775 [Sulfitobacter sp. SK011]|jgi:hypothetical protein|nr:hypothetical protein C1J02_03775 [Sulfitobacter sp. SK011]